MSLDDNLRRAKALGPKAAMRAGLRHGWRIAFANFVSLWSFFRRTYRDTDIDPRQLGSFVPRIPVSMLDPHAETLRRITALYLDHRFDLLGSGWGRVAHSMAAPGFQGTVYPTQPTPGDVTLRLNPGNRGNAVRLRKMIDRYYLPIDWQMDFKSGYRWREDRPSDAILFGHRRGVDVKLPWELARLQHLVPLVWAYILSDADRDGFFEPADYLAEFRNQALDFFAANPPGHGVNWASSMDVAIRAANLAVAFDLFRAHGGTFDNAFNRAFAAALWDHGNHIVYRLEQPHPVRGNHYLCEVAGLLVTAAYLPPANDTDEWLAFGVRALIVEVRTQFGRDGAHFEGSTSYHRLVAEAVIYATALIAGLDETRKRAIVEPASDAWREALPDGAAEMKLDPERIFPAEHFAVIEKMADFTIGITKPNGRIAQIGDNDSGRFFKIWPIFDTGGGPAECHLDHRGLTAAACGLIDRTDFETFAGPESALETALVAGLAKAERVSGAAGTTRAVLGDADEPDPLPCQREFVVYLRDPAMLNGLVTESFPEFGLYIWRGPQFFLSVRCGRVGGPGPGAHAHNDQLAVELNIDGEDWLADPGSYVYTPDPAARNAYRSVAAHAAPRVEDQEPASLNDGLFRLNDATQAKCIEFTATRFVGSHTGFGAPIYRSIEIGDGKVVIRDGLEGGSGHERNEVRDPNALRRAMGVDTPFSPGYGIKEN